MTDEASRRFVAHHHLKQAAKGASLPAAPTPWRRAGRPVPANDIWIAAAAMGRGLRVLTLDRHYLEIPQILVEMFEAGKG